LFNENTKKVSMLQQMNLGLTVLSSEKVRAKMEKSETWLTDLALQGRQIIVY